MQYWLMKSEPEVFSIDDLNRSVIEAWDGVRNYQARNFIKQMKINDLVFFYHSNCNPPGIAGLMRIAKEAYPDHTSWDRATPYYDPKSTSEAPRWFMVDVSFVQKFRQFIPLKTLRQHKELEDLLLLRKGNRLSVMPVSGNNADFIIRQLAGQVRHP